MFFRFVSALRYVLVAAAPLLTGNGSQRETRIGLLLAPDTLDPIVSTQYIENDIEEAAPAFTIAGAALAPRGSNHSRYSDPDADRRPSESRRRQRRAPASHRGKDAGPLNAAGAGDTGARGAVLYAWSGDVRGLAHAREWK